MERPVNVVKELVENAIDAGASAITVEIREGGKKMIRVTDNGCGIEKSQITKAFERHATSKIRDDSDLTRLVSLGFRGEALSSIAAVSQVEMITKTRDSLTGIRATNQLLSGYSEDDRVKLDLEEIGAPDGTSVVVRNLFYNVPVRSRFLKQPQTEAGYITDLVERQALSHPSISFHYRVDGREKLHTTGNGDLRELLYRIYGREISKKVLPVSVSEGNYRLDGFIGRPEISRTTRNFEVFFVAMPQEDRVIHGDTQLKDSCKSLCDITYLSEYYIASEVVKYCDPYTYKEEYRCKKRIHCSTEYYYCQNNCYQNIYGCFFFRKILCVCNDCAHSA